MGREDGLDVVFTWRDICGDVRQGVDDSTRAFLIFVFTVA